MSRSHSEPSLFDDDMIEKSPRAKKTATKKVAVKKAVAKKVAIKVAKKAAPAKKKLPPRKKVVARKTVIVSESVEEAPRIQKSKGQTRPKAAAPQSEPAEIPAEPAAVERPPTAERPPQEPARERRDPDREYSARESREPRESSAREPREPRERRESSAREPRERRESSAREPRESREPYSPEPYESRGRNYDDSPRENRPPRDGSQRRPSNRGRRDRRPSNDTQGKRSPEGLGQGQGPDPGGEPRDRGPRREAPLGPPTAAYGMVELSPKGFGFLRQPETNYYQSNKDTFIPPDMVRNYGLRDGLMLTGEAKRGPRGMQLTGIEKINDRDPKDYLDLPVFEELTAVNPSKRWILETSAKRHTTRIIDMMTPVGRGQRGLIVAPPRTGKTTLIQHIAEAILENYPDARVIILLVDERPEEVTEITRALPKAEVVASSNDNDTRTHMRIAELTIERAKRLVEVGEDVFILLDSITRLARAFNRANRGKGGMNKGGLSNRALEVPRRLFAAARNTREAGSLTILATALIDTGTMMDEAIFQEFKGTGNMELVLDKKISQSYVYPAVDIFKSGTRREELLLPPHQLEKIVFIRRGLSGHKPIEAIERLLSFVERFPSNAQMLLEIKKPSA